jgi:hypothetical protein
LSGFLSFCSWLYQRKNYFESFIADIGKLFETKQCIALTIFFVYRNTSKKKACTAMVSVRQNANDNFNNPREATVEVFENIRTIEITYTPGTLIDRLIIRFHEIQNTASLSAVKFILQLESEEEIQLTFGSPGGMSSFVEAITLAR